MNNLKQKLLDTEFFIDNEWLDKYVYLIEQNKNTEEKIGITQIHHILQRKYYNIIKQKCDNSKSNLVNLKYSDHILAHYFLCYCTKHELKAANYYTVKLMSGLNNIDENFIEEFKNNKDVEYDSWYNEWYSYISNILEKNREKAWEKSKESCGKKVSAYDKDGKIIKTFDSVRDAGRFLGNIELAKNITQCCQGKRRLVHDFQWQYGEELKIDSVREDMTGKYPKKNLRKKVAQLDLETEKVICIFDSITEAAKQTKTDSGSISKVVNKKRKSAGGYKWKIVKENNE